MANWSFLFLFAAISVWGIIVLEHQEARKALVEQEMVEWR